MYVRSRTPPPSSMPRGKIQMSLIGDARDRAKAFARRKAGLVKKAKELTKLCDVDIALVVCAGPDGAPAVWESDPSVVIDRYRRLPADKRGRSTRTWTASTASWARRSAGSTRSGGRV